MPGPQFSYGDGTLSVDQDSATVTGSGTAWSTTVKAGDQVYALVGTEWVFVGAVDEVTDDLELTLQDDYPGSSLSDANYRILRGVGWFTGAQVHDSIVRLMTELGPMGLVGVTSGRPDPETGRENELRIDATQNVIYQKRAGNWEVVAAQLAFSAVGDLADRSDHDDEDADFVFFALDEQEFYIKLSGEDGDWSDGISVRGPQGEAATVEVGDTTTLDWDQDATVANSGDSTHAVLDFGVPRGDVGRTGLRYAFDDSTDTETHAGDGLVWVGMLSGGDPSTGEIAVAKEDALGGDRNAQLMQLIESSTVEFRAVDHDGFRAFHVIDTPDGSDGDFVSLPIELVAEHGSLSAGDRVDVIITKIGLDGADPGYLMTWETGTSAPSLPGKIRADDADLSEAETIYISKTTRGGADIGARLLEMGLATRTVPDTLILTQSTDELQASWAVDGMSDEGDYVAVTVSDHAGATSFSGGDAISVQPRIAGSDGSIASVNLIAPNTLGDVRITSGDIPHDDGRTVAEHLDDIPSRDPVAMAIIFG